MISDQRRAGKSHGNHVGDGEQQGPGAMQSAARAYTIYHTLQTQAVTSQKKRGSITEIDRERGRKVEESKRFRKVQNEGNTVFARQGEERGEKERGEGGGETRSNVHFDHEKPESDRNGEEDAHPAANPITLDYLAYYYHRSK